MTSPTELDMTSPLPAEITKPLEKLIGSFLPPINISLAVPVTNESAPVTAPLKLSFAKSATLRKQII